MISQFINDKGNAVKNHFVISDEDGSYLQSYDSVVALVKHDGSIVLGTDYNYSRTTMKHVFSFVNLSSKEINQAVKENTIEVQDLKV